MQVSYTTNHLTDYHCNSIEMAAIVKRCAVFLLLVLVLLLLNTIGVLFIMGIVAVYTVPQSVIALFLMVSIMMATIEQLVIYDSAEHKHYA